MTEIPTLFDTVDVVLSTDAETPEQAFRRFRTRHPWFISRLATMAAEQKARGFTRVSMKGLFELLRTQMTAQGDTYALDNTFTSLAAREVVRQYPDLDGLFVFRKRKGER